MNTAHDLTLRLAELLRSERSALAEFLLALAAFHRDERWRELGHTSLFYFLRRELGLSAGAAQHRKTAAELILDFPGIVEPIREGRLCLSTVCKVQKVLTRENWRDLLPRFFGLSKREAEALVAELQPAEVVPLRAVVTAVRAPAPPSREAQSGPDGPSFTHGAFHLGETMIEIKSGPAPVRLAPPPRDTAVPLTSDLRRVHYTVSKRFLDKLDRARDALSHSDPRASVEQILEKGLDLILDRSAKRRGLVAKPRKAKIPSLPPERGSRYVPAE
ncbi:MAG TPA: HNH endonuclease, partial [Anaeromyxobacteraceae bacterium]|nr:HNH endonuclease [Anaeromyxobacteraceae bacterium]